MKQLDELKKEFEEFKKQQKLKEYQSDSETETSDTETSDTEENPLDYGIIKETKKAKTEAKKETINKINQFDKITINLEEVKKGKTTHKTHKFETQESDFEF